MPKVRTLEHETWSDPDLGSLSFGARLLAIAMITHLADDEGRLKADPRQLKKEVFGYDDLSVADVEKLLDEVHAKLENFVQYEVDGRRYFWLKTFAAKQGIRYIVKSTLPRPEDGVVKPSEINGCESLPRISEIAEISCSESSESRVEKGSVENPPVVPPDRGDAPPKPSRKPREKKTATKLPDGWRPSQKTIDAMKAECPGVDFRREHAKFTDYWKGTGKAKADWEATWRNWMRRAFEDLQRRSPPSSSSGSPTWNRAPEKPE